MSEISSNASDTDAPALLLRYADGPEAVIDYIQSIEDLDSRRSMYSLAQRTFGRASFAGRDLDSIITIIQAGIDEGLRQSAAASDIETSDKYKNFSNVLAYNLSADLAECWPEDNLPRDRRHFEIGLQAAEDCLKWRRELQKGPFPFSIAWWAKGIHQLSLGDFAEAAASFDKAQDYGIQNAQSLSHKHDPNGDFNVVLNKGYSGLARKLAGNPDGASQFESACDRFRTIAASSEGDEKDDAEFGVAQLMCASERISAERGLQTV